MDGPRFPELTRDRMTPEQARVADAIMSGPRKGMRGPHNAWLRRPELADRFQKVGEYILFGTILPPRLRELAILLVARRWDAQFEWFAHYDMALAAGLERRIADAIRRGVRPVLAADEEIVFDFAVELLTAGEVSDPSFDAAKQLLGEDGVIDLVGSITYYICVALVLNVDRHPVPAPDPMPLKRLPHGFAAAMRKSA
jgi:4-carboxymuconolactone decarboxylase